ncbi:hypothetical protein VNI00_017612 [Paramarasmius palmivorus]|uniref:Uncharacterized protein n=1 Tax=Paramarasmius palmivorus TaxID=297713 RepID=A0AAW0B6X9_9AGAR
MGGFALYDDGIFYGYVWNNGEVKRDNPSGVEVTVRNEIQEYYRAFRTSAVDLDRKHGKTRRRSLAENEVSETDKMRLIATTVVEPMDNMNSQDLEKNSDLLEFLIKSGHIKITENEIMDNLSHSDSITKIIAVIQTAWFLLQVGARAVEGLAITELEIITVGFAVLNFGTYFLWWNKPLRIRHPVRVYWRQQVIEAKRDGKKSNGGIERGLPPKPKRALRLGKEVKWRWMAKLGKEVKWGWMAKVREFVAGVWTSVQDASIEFWESIRESIIVLINFLKDIRGQLNNKTFPGINWVTLLQLVGLPFLVVLRLIWASGFIIGDSSDDYTAFVINSSRLEEESFTLYILVYGLTTLFGAIHCIPWNFQFPTHTEQLLWRISAGGLVVLPIGAAVITVIGGIIFAFIACCAVDIGYFLAQLGFIIDIFLLPIAYFVSRVILMVLALMELRNLPQSAYQTVQWTTFIPHIG